MLQAALWEVFMLKRQALVEAVVVVVLMLPYCLTAESVSDLLGRACYALMIVPACGFSKFLGNPATVYASFLLEVVPQRLAWTLGATQCIFSFLGATLSLLLYTSTSNKKKSSSSLMIIPKPPTEDFSSVVRVLTVEFALTFCLVFVTLQMLILAPRAGARPLSVGACAAVTMIAAAGVSGGALNPAIVLALQLRSCIGSGNCGPLLYLPVYLAAQFGAAFAAAKMHGVYISALGSSSSAAAVAAVASPIRSPSLTGQPSQPPAAVEGNSAEDSMDTCAVVEILASPLQLTPPTACSTECDKEGSKQR